MATLSLVLRPKSVCAELSISQATFWRLVKSEQIKTLKISARCTGVLRADLDTYLSKLK